MTPTLKMPLTEWRKMTCIESGDTRQTIWTDTHVFYQVFCDNVGTLWYVTYHEIDDQDGAPDGLWGKRVRLEPRNVWIDIDESGDDSVLIHSSKL